jgi:hypothetical protein
MSFNASIVFHPFRALHFEGMGLIRFPKHRPSADARITLNNGILASSRPPMQDMGFHTIGFCTAGGTEVWIILYFWQTYLSLVVFGGPFSFP